MGAPLRLAAITALALLVAPSAAAHDDPAATTYDPLTFSADVWPTADRALAYAQPVAASLVFPPAGPVAGIDPPASVLEFSLTSPVRFVLGHGLDASLVIAAEKPVVMRDADGNAVELSILLDGKEVPDATKKIALDPPVMRPGDTVTVHAIVQAPTATFAKGANLTLRVRLLLAEVPADALRLLVGPSKATLDSMRVPSVKDLELEDSDFQLFLPSATSFVPNDASALVVTARVGHGTVDLTSTVVRDDRRAFLVLIGDEPVADARAGHDFPDRERRVNASHQFVVGASLVRVHPGVAVVVPLGAGPLPVRVTCVKNCPASFGATITFATGRASPTSDATAATSDSALIPPPPPTSGIAVSKDAPAAAGRSIPASGLAGLLACVLLAVTWPRSRP